MSAGPQSGTPPPSIAFEARGVRASLGGIEVLHGVDLSLHAGCWTAVIGPNGAGKSTLVKVLAGLLPHRGEVRILGQAPARLPTRARALQLAWLGQDGAGDASADDLSVYDVAMLGRLPHQRWLASPSDADRAAVERALRSTQTWQWRARRLAQLSGGERQRVLLARALAVEAPLLLMDEPLANLDPPHQVDWMENVRRLVAEGRTVVSVLYELNAALAADRLVVMQNGSVVHHGACGEPETHRVLERVFDHRLVVHRVAGHWLALPR